MVKSVTSFLIQSASLGNQNSVLWMVVVPLVCFTKERILPPFAGCLESILFLSSLDSSTITFSVIGIQQLLGLSILPAGLSLILLKL